MDIRIYDDGIHTDIYDGDAKIGMLIQNPDAKGSDRHGFAHLVGAGFDLRSSLSSLMIEIGPRPNNIYLEEAMNTARVALKKSYGETS